MEEGGKKPDRRDVNAIWQQLNASRPASNRDFDKLWHGFSSDISRSNKPCSSSTQDTAKKQAQQLKLDPLIGKLAVVRQTSASQEQQQKLAPPTDLEGAALDRLVQALQSPDANVRKAALHQVQVAFVSRTPPPSAEDVAEALSCKLGKALLRRFEDKSEACREAAVSTFNAMLQAGADATLSLLPYAIPVLEERLFIQQGQGSAEPSEEVRLLLLQLLGVIVAQAGSAVAAYASEVWSVLSAGLADSFHEAAEQACRTVQQLAGCLGMRLSTISKDIVAALLPLTTHKRHRTRIAAIEALRDVMHLGSHNMILEMGAHEAILDMVGWRDPNVVPIRAFYGDDLKVNYCGKLATDHHPQVRLAFLGMVGSWLLTLRERLDHQPRLLPYLLSGLCDESPAVVQAAVQLLEQLGEQYEQEHENDLADLIRFGGQAQHANEAAFLQALQQGAVAYKAATAAAGQSTHSEEEPNAAAAVFIVPGPFSQRPRIGSRLVISNNFSVALHALCAELSSWQSGPRAMSASLLRVNLVLTESAAERHLQVLLPALCASVRDEDAGPAVADCAALLGCHCSLQLLLELLEPRALDASAEAKKQADVLLVLEAVLR
ncbi:hypothetical protein OEZ86_009159 [Tetradesmus obliquus]|nr:hypothetical protein OEZ86_009159 [Tetradesmus obliquus]